MILYLLIKVVRLQEKIQIKSVQVWTKFGDDFMLLVHLTFSARIGAPSHDDSTVASGESTSGSAAAGESTPGSPPHTSSALTAGDSCQEM